tara:strand:- start:141 stop:833 length:693 start_codon:yes stop_codon:yes gene_type:complete
MHLLINKKRIYLYLLIFLTLNTLVNIRYSKNLSEYFYLKNIEIVGLNFEYQNKLKEDLKIFKGKNIFFINDHEISNILDKYNEFKQYKIQRIFPSKLKLEIIKTKFIAKTIRDGKELLVGENKKFIELKNFNLDQDLPSIFGNFPIESFVILQKNLKKSNFDIHTINNYFYFKIGRWDLELDSNITIKLPINNQFTSLKRYELFKNQNKLTENSIIDFRIPKKIIILNDK